MNTEEKKEKINLLLELRCLYNNSGKPNYARIITDCINDLENNNKYKQIVEDIKQYIIDRKTIEEDFATNSKDIIDLIDWLKRKYFPKDNSINELPELINKMKGLITEATIICEKLA